MKLMTFDGYFSVELAVHTEILKVLQQGISYFPAFGSSTRLADNVRQGRRRGG